MTAIVGMMPGGYPVQIGDLLISSDRMPRRPIAVPTLGNLESAAAAPWHATDMRQTTPIIADNIAVSWAGSYIAARHVINELRELSCRSKTGLSHVMEYFANLDPWIRQQPLSILGHVAQEGDGGSFSYNCKQVLSETLGDVRVAGSGCRDVLQFMQQLKQPIPLPQLNPLERAIVSALMITGVLTNEELLTQSNLASFYGGGYEVCSLVQRKFTKISDITYLWWTLQTTKQGYALSQPRCALKYQYYGDLLAVYASDFTTEGSTGERIRRDRRRIHVISPVYRKASEAELSEVVKQVNMNSRFLCNLIAYRNQRAEIHLCSLLSHSVSGVHPVKFQEDAGRLTIAVKQEFLETIVKSARARDDGGLSDAEWAL